MCEPPESSALAGDEQDGPIDLAGVLNKLQRELDLAERGDECAFDLLFGLDH